MFRTTGTYRMTSVGGEEVRAFIPHPLPPKDPPLELDETGRELLNRATNALSRLALAGEMVPSTDWFLYGFVRKEAVVSSQIEGTQATLRDVLNFEATQQTDRPEDVEEVCNYVEALTYARRQIADPEGLPISTRLLCETHRHLMKGVRGEDKQPGEVRRSQNWIGGTRPGNAIFVPPPPDDVGPALSALEKWIHADDSIAPLIKAGLAHVQFETIHPFLDGNGRIGRLLITLLVEKWGLLDHPWLYLSLAFRRRQSLYYEQLSNVRIEGDWEGWIAFFLECVQEAAEDGTDVAQRLFALIDNDRRQLTHHDAASVSVLRLFELLPAHPIVTLPRAMDLLQTSKPTAAKALKALVDARVLQETTGKKRDRVYAYQRYIRLLTGDQE